VDFYWVNSNLEFEPMEGYLTELVGEKLTLADLNKTLCVVRFGGKVKIATWTDSPVFPGLKMPGFFDVAAMRTYFANRFIRVKIDQNSYKDIPIFPFWLQHPDAPRADGVTLSTDSARFVGGALNLWTGFGLKSEAGKWPLLRKHIERVIGAGDTASGKYVLKWCAWTLQNPLSPSEVALVMRGLKGSGKGVLGNLFRRIFGAHGLQISSPKHLVGNFNSHLMHCCLLFADEAFWAGDAAAEGSLKRMITESTLTVEPKGIDAFEAVNRLSIIMASNEAWVVPASVDERRFAVFDVSGERCGDRAYFDALHKELYQNGGAEAFLHDMLAMDLEDWHPRFDIPQTAGLKAQQVESEKPEVHWLWSLLENGELPSHSGNSTRARELFEIAKRSHPKMGYWTEIRQAKLLKSIGAFTKRRSDGNHWVFPALSEARTNFGKAYPNFEPFTEGGVEWASSLVAGENE
jgi:hypothetical protein